MGENAQSARPCGQGPKSYTYSKRIVTSRLRVNKYSKLRSSDLVAELHSGLAAGRRPIISVGRRVIERPRSRSYSQRATHYPPSSERADRQDQRDAPPRYPLPSRWHWLKVVLVPYSTRMLLSNPSFPLAGLGSRKLIEYFGSVKSLHFSIPGSRE